MARRHRGKFRTGLGGSVAVCVLAGFALPILWSTPPHPNPPAVTVRASVSASGMQADGESTGPTLSDDGRLVAFVSFAGNLVTGDSNGVADVFVKDLLTGWVTRASVSSTGVQGNGESFAPSISSDGRFVAFTSEAGNLVDADENEDRDVFVHDRVTGSTVRASVGPLGEEADAGSYAAAISADGRYVAFASHARNLASDDQNRASDVFVKDLLTSSLERMSVGPAGVPSDGSSEGTSISADGRWVAFASTATNLLAEPMTHRVWHVYVRDRSTGTIVRASLATDSTQADGQSFAPSLSGDGRYVAFTSRAGNLVAGDTNAAPDVFVRDLQVGITTRVSVSSDGAQADAHSSNPSISGDGRFVVFYSHASNLIADDTNSVQDVFLHDRASGMTTRVSVGLWSQAGGASLWPSISRDGRYVAFPDGSSDLVAGDTNGRLDVFVRGPLF